VICLVFPQTSQLEAMEARARSATDDTLGLAKFVRDGNSLDIHEILRAMGTCKVMIVWGGIQS
jgi:hypothetical protein